MYLCDMGYAVASYPIHLTHYYSTKYNFFLFLLYLYYDGIDYPSRINNIEIGYMVFWRLASTMG